MKAVIIDLPWFHEDCRPNRKNKSSWRSHHEAKKRQKNIAQQLATAHYGALSNKQTELTIIFNPRRRGCDLDNCLASIKGALDGVAAALKIDDKNFYPITLDFGEYGGDGSIEIILTQH